MDTNTAVVPASVDASHQIQRQDSCVTDGSGNQNHSSTSEETDVITAWLRLCSSIFFATLPVLLEVVAHPSPVMAPLLIFAGSKKKKKKNARCQVHFRMALILA
jgi:hypothetical protein